MTNSFRNSGIADWVSLIALVTVVYTKRKFSKLKLIKSKLILIMLQERLSELTMLWIEMWILEKYECKNLIIKF